ncbi:MAG: efflux transporter periplasmic adaptor subunit [Nevskia sp.]|nr:efflux transporter periplasmic adaptor subunit [Nevskia sp.]
MKRWLIMIGVVLALVLVIGGLKGFGIFKMVQGLKAEGLPKQTISTVKVDFQEWQTQIGAVGSLRAVRGADLSSEVSGVVESVQFESGNDVKAGQPLIRLRAADVAATLESLKAQADLAAVVYKRDQAQLEAQAISQAVLDNDAASLKNAKAQVAAQAAALAKKYINAPFAGHLGIRAVDVGQYLNPGDKIVTLQTLDPIYVDFSIPQQSLAQLAVGQKVTAHTDTFAGVDFSGEISAIDPKVDTDTRNVSVRATLKNPEHKLLPGMFASVDIATGAPERFLTLPQNAITFNPYGETVFLVTTAAKLKAEQEAKAKAEGTTLEAPPKNPLGLPEPSGDELVSKQQFVTVGATRGDQIVILKGIAAGDQVVTSGQLKLKNGSAVVINNKVQPSDDPNPKPSEN